MVEESGKIVDPEPQEAPAIHAKLTSKAYFTWLRHYGLHPMLQEKHSVIQEAHAFASAIGALDDAGQVPSVTQSMAEDMGLAGVDDHALNVKTA